MRSILSGLWLITIVANAQTFKHTSIVISKEVTNVFPLISSTSKPRVAAAINKALQMVSFNHTNVEKNPESFVDEERYSSWNYAVDYANDRLLHVMTQHTFPKQSMNTPEFTNELHFWFDTATGDQVWPWQFITEEGLARMRLLVADRMGDMMKKRHAELVKKFPPKEYASSLPNLEENIRDMKKNISDPTRYPHQYNPAVKSFTFFAAWDAPYDREEMEADLDNGIQVIIPTADIKPFSSQFWSYYILRASNTPPAPDPISHTWCGMIGGKIPVTFLIMNHPASTTISGLEVYDKHGGTINLKGGLKGNAYWFDEIDDKGTKTGSFEFTSANGKLTGMWKNGDGTKTMDFKAAIGGADL